MIWSITSISLRSLSRLSRAHLDSPSLWVVQGWRFSCVFASYIWGFGLCGTFRFFQKGWFTPVFRQLAGPPFSFLSDGPPQHGVWETLQERSARWPFPKTESSVGRKVPMPLYNIKFFVLTSLGNAMTSMVCKNHLYYTILSISMPQQIDWIFLLNFVIECCFCFQRKLWNGSEV